MALAASRGAAHRWLDDAPCAAGATARDSASIVFSRRGEGGPTACWLCEAKCCSTTLRDRSLKSHAACGHFHATGTPWHAACAAQSVRTQPRRGAGHGDRRSPAQRARPGPPGLALLSARSG